MLMSQKQPLEVLKVVFGTSTSLTRSWDINTMIGDALSRMSSMNTTLEYHLGKANVVADALSRKIVAALSLQHNDWRLANDGALLAQLKAQPVLKQMIIDAQKKDEKL